MRRIAWLMSGMLAIGLTAMAGAADEKAAAPETPAQGGMPMPPGLSMPPGGSVMQPGKSLPFPPPAAMGITNINPDTLRKVMQARSELDELTRKLQARQAEIYESDKRIQELQAKMREVQKDIDDILAKDEELTALRAKLDSLFNAPMPMPAAPASVEPSSKGAPATPEKTQTQAGADPAAGGKK